MKVETQLNSKKHRFFGLSGGATGWLLGDLASQHPRIIYICRNRSELEALQEEIPFFRKDVRILPITGWETLPFEEVSAQTEVAATRITNLLELSRSDSYIALVTPEAILQKNIALTKLQKLSITVSINQKIDREQFIKQLTEASFSRAANVESIGQYAIRGGVIDIFPATTALPIRLDFSDDVVEEIRTFDPESQRSNTEKLTSIIIDPVKEVLCYANGFTNHLELNNAIDKLKLRGKFLQTPPREIARFMSAVRTSMSLPGIELINQILEENTESIFDLAPQNATWIINDEIGLHQTLETLHTQTQSRYDRLVSDHHLIPEFKSSFLDTDTSNEKIKSFASIYIDQILPISINEEEYAITNLRSTSVSDFSWRIQAKQNEQSEKLSTEIDKYRKKGLSVCFVVGSANRAEKLKKLLADSNIEAPIGFYSACEWIQNDYRPPVIILIGVISDGFILPKSNSVFIAEHQVFPERSHKKHKQKTFNLKRILQSLSKLSEGDFVVHSDYGIGLYKGLKHFTVEDGQGDFLHIEYADSTLYVPIQNISRVQKFSATEGQTPSLDKLASTRWVKTKEKVRASVATLAGDLIRLYAARSVAKGWRFEPYGADDENFSETFPFNETPDQQKAIEETIDDMAQDRVMDRLVCGDVGFGKTEVAIRAAYKCVRHGRQVAVLVPTTILVEQHRKNFVNRFQEYDVNIAAMSRFNSAKKNKEIIEGAKNGTIDIVLGTHRLLSKDVAFKDLGLLIIDEEHRFGVKQKEQLKALKRSIDVLTLTATPIPRTLHMSLLGIRDISVIQTPPQDRRSIRTYVANFDMSLVRDAILREIQRGGQVFYLHNRVQSIDAVTATLKEHIPEATFRFAHGQMSETQLESIMIDFIDRKFDVLVCTTIVESGIDIPNANTLIIERADTFGLAQLYQIRGRVGRSTRQAYAYLLVQKTKNLSDDARRRLSALQSLDELGMGFNLAMQDLEIRGAGNLLGKEQSGNVLAIGFDLYTKILKEAILHVKGEELDLSEIIDPEVKLPIAAFIPETYIPDISERLIMYQRLSGIETDLETEDLLTEIDDRFGPPPKEVRSLLNLMKLRALLRRFGITKLELQGDGITLSLSKRAPVDLNKIMDLCKKFPDTFKFGKSLTLSIRLKSPDRFEPDEIHPLVEEALFRIKS